MKNLKELLNDPIGSRLVTAFVAYISSTALPSLISGLADNKVIRAVYDTVNDWFVQQISISAITFYYLVLSLSFFGFLAYVIVKSTFVKSPIKWSFDHFIGMQNHTTARGTYWYAQCFQAGGINSSKDPIKHMEGHLRVDNTGETYPMKFLDEGEVKGLDTLLAIPPDERLDICVHFTRDQDIRQWIGLSPASFLERFVPFTFCVSIDDKYFEYRFSEKKIKNELFSTIYRRDKKRRGPVFRDDRLI